jgi:hypothetical protein
LHLLSPFIDDIGLRRESIGSALPKFPSSVSDGGMVSRLHWFAARCGLSSCLPPDGSDWDFAQPTGTFTPELPASRSPFSSSGITTVATEHFHRWDFHPLEGQLASLHRLFHPLQHAGLSRPLRFAVHPSTIQSTHFTLWKWVPLPVSRSSAKLEEVRRKTLSQLNVRFYETD